MFCVYQNTTLLYSKAILYLGDISAIKLKKQVMNINAGLNSVVAKATTIPMPLQR